MSRTARMAIPVSCADRGALEIYGRFQSVSRYVLTNQRLLDVVMAADILAATRGRVLVMVVYSHPENELSFASEVPETIRGFQGSRVRAPDSSERQLHLVYSADSVGVVNACMTVSLATLPSVETQRILHQMALLVAGKDTFRVNLEHSGQWNVV